MAFKMSEKYVTLLLGDIILAVAFGSHFKL